MTSDWLQGRFRACSEMFQNESRGFAGLQIILNDTTPIMFVWRRALQSLAIKTKLQGRNARQMRDAKAVSATQVSSSRSSNSCWRWCTSPRRPWSVGHHFISMTSIYSLIRTRLRRWQCSRCLAGQVRRMYSGTRFKILKHSSAVRWFISGLCAIRRRLEDVCGERDEKPHLNPRSNVNYMPSLQVLSIVRLSKNKRKVGRNT